MSKPSFRRRDKFESEVSNRKIRRNMMLAFSQNFLDKMSKIVNIDSSFFKKLKKNTYTGYVFEIGLIEP